MLARFLAVAAFGVLVPLNSAFAENPWGPDCKSLEDCLEYLHAPSQCAADDFACKNYEQASPLQPGLQMEFEKFGKAAVPPLVEILKSGSQLEVARAAEALWSSGFITPPDYSIIHAAWWRVPGGSIGLLASRYSTPEFVREVIAELRRNPLKDGDVANTFSNFREYPNEKPNGVIAAMTEHIECSSGEPCDPAFAKLQYAWIDSNALEIGTIGTRLAGAIQNPVLDGPAKLAALEYFRPSEYFRTKEMMRDFAVPIVREQLKSSLPEIRLEAARILTTYGDTGGIDVLFELAEDAAFGKRTSALISLASIGNELESYLPRIKKLLNDQDWDVRRHAVILLGTRFDENLIDDLISQIDPQDWLISYSAVSALQEFSNEKARQALQHVAKTYWHPLVRDAAAKKMEADPNLSQYPAEEAGVVKLTSDFLRTQRFPVYEMQDAEITGWCKARFERDGYRFVPDFITGPDVAAQAGEASNFNGDHFEKTLLGQDVMKGATKLEAQMKFEGWSFVGSVSDGRSDQSPAGERAGQLVVFDAGHSPSVVLAKNIAALFQWQGEPFVITSGTGVDPRGDGYLYKLFQRDSQTWSAQPVMRLSGIPQFWKVDSVPSASGSELRYTAVSQVWMATNQAIGILGSGGAMLISPDYSPAWIGCSQPSFP